jgi:hypothetical protein
LSQFRGHFSYRHAVFEPNCAVDSGLEMLMILRLHM